ncbi:MAG: DUF3108 domain-containing protein [Hyphomicrobiales bacterium]
MSRFKRFFQPKTAVIAGFAASAVLLGSAGFANAADDKIKMKYDVYSSGLKVYRINLHMNLGPKAYSTKVDMKAKGFLKVFADARIDMSSRGLITGKKSVLPRAFKMTSKSKKNRSVALKWDGKKKPTAKRNYNLEPDRAAAVSKVLTPKTSNPLTFLVRHAAQPAAKACAGSERMYTGKEVWEYRFKRKGATKLDSKKYSGPALKCTITMHPVAGLSERKWEKVKANPGKPFTVWYAPLAGKNGTHLVPVAAKGEMRGKSFELRVKSGEIDGVSIKKRVAALK